MKWLLFFIVSVGFSQEYQFKGKHLITSYSKCDIEALTNVEELRKKMEEAVIASGATLLDSAVYFFTGNAMTMVLLLSESHASIHTYPEYGSCFIDLFTCGDKCKHVKFDQVLRKYLKPESSSEMVLER